MFSYRSDGTCIPKNTANVYSYSVTGDLTFTRGTNSFWFPDYAYEYFTNNNGDHYLLNSMFEYANHNVTASFDLISTPPAGIDCDSEECQLINYEDHK